MSLVNLFGGRAMSLSPAFIQTVQSRAITTGCAHIKVGGCCYSVSHVKSLDGFCVQSIGNRGLLGRLLGRSGGGEGRVAALELQFNQNRNPIKAHNEYISKIFESSI
ncbi:hypothetical protein [Citrobacter rodentium]|uniref:Uncharacterized protein n=1 Tax=Citrobacter rodentium (strain ICC168) TaxID=637910 RepID=D2TI17_CITRI|nr:hypothetical protein [Citrobacter rodentium]UHO32227.1 hypothetical protein K7R23_05910 [Citrobacter rodentium NBRC 105723 = DSM 16636]CBG90794.1 hypothetical protein ROD_40931 [Citrobacter rodentium ICC168]HAT8012596.1 hypothetical protein [Citrobacter rodentium NBRC 105723 = DSM 16636]HAT8017896.1 hypothetical protein [Citrobacter rodentium]HAT8027434.1 hypothetical protein [Citrobacter rodentium]